MIEVIIRAGSGRSRIIIGEELKNISKYFEVNKSIIITDDNVCREYIDAMQEYRIIKIAAGEKNKNLLTIDEIYRKLIEYKADRNTILIGVGGGVVCDITGFVASTFLRGVRFGFVASTLLAASDAAIGGKNGVNYTGYKNLIGNFNQPDIVLFDPMMLKTLPPEELLCGYSEIIKHGIILQKDLFNYLKENHEKIKQGSYEVILELVYRSVKVKSAIIERDERENGVRAKLNFGHTIGHALERMACINHGKAVSIGMIGAARISMIKAALNQNEFNEIYQMLKTYGLPVEFKFDKERLIADIIHDKKRYDDNINFVLIDSIGQSISKRISLRELREIYNELY
jgi:3-dehydroquinate synthase